MPWSLAGHAAGEVPHEEPVDLDVPLVLGEHNTWKQQKEGKDQKTQGYVFRSLGDMQHRPG